MLASSDRRFYSGRCHQQYLAKNPNGYCGLGGTGISCPVGVANVVDDATAEAE